MNTGPKKFVFVLMPFHDDYEDVYRAGIKPACEATDCYCERVDEQIFHESILDRIYNQITKADLIVADMTGRNPNVFYETGYAHALNKKVILLTQNADDIPFDLKHYPHIVYRGKIATLKEELQKRVSWYLNQPDVATIEEELLQYYLHGQILEDDAVVNISENKARVTKSSDESKHAIELVMLFHIYNNSDKTAATRKLRFSIILPDRFKPFGPYGSFAKAVAAPPSFILPGGSTSVKLKHFADLLPGDWHEDLFRLQCTWNSLRIPAKLRIHSERGTKDITFTMVVTPNSGRF